MRRYRLTRSRFATGAQPGHATFNTGELPTHGRLNGQGDHDMNTNRKQFAIGIGSLAASGLLTLAVPTGTSAAMIWKPPMPCVAVHAGVYPAGAGLCPGTTRRLGSNKSWEWRGVL